MRFLAVLPPLLLLLSGCTGGEGAQPEAAPAGPAASTESAGPVDLAAPRRPTTEVVEVPVSFEGDLGTVAFACEAATGQCAGHEVVADECDFYHEEPGAVLRGLEITLEWDAATPATETLAFEVMVMGPNGTMLDSVSGPSPLTVRAEGLDVLLDGEHVVHAYPYNEKGFVPVPAAGFAYASVQQPIRMTGAISVERALA